MKTEAPKTHSSNSPAHSSQPFFNRPGEGSFLNAEATEQPFFSSSFLQPKLAVGQPNDPYEQEAAAMADKVMSKDAVIGNRNLGIQKQQALKEQPLPAKPLQPGAVRTNIIQTKESPKVRALTSAESDKIKASILQTFVKYNQLKINLPDKKGTAKVRAAYWIGSRKRKFKKHNRLVNRLKKEIEADIQAGTPAKLPKTKLEKKGLHLRILMNSGKASPEQLEQFIQIAVNEAHKSTPRRRKKKMLPTLGKDSSQWEAIIQKWVNTYQIGIDCSGFVFEALRKVHRDLGGSAAEEKYIGQFGRKKGRIDMPMSSQQVDKKRATKVEQPKDLRPGDLMQYYKHSPDDKVTRHIRILASAYRKPGADGKTEVVFTVVESKGSGSKQGPTMQVFKFPDETDKEFKNIKKLVGSKWKRDKKQDKFNYFHPKFEF